MAQAHLTMITIAGGLPMPVLQPESPPLSRKASVDRAVVLELWGMVNRFVLVGGKGGVFCKLLKNNVDGVGIMKMTASWTVLGEIYSRSDLHILFVSQQTNARRHVGRVEDVCCIRELFGFGDEVFGENQHRHVTNPPQTSAPISASIATWELALCTTSCYHLAANSLEMSHGDE